MSTMKRVLKPDRMARYRPYLGCRVDGKQHRFNLGTDKTEAERRMNLLYELWAENIRANGEELWSPLALSFARQIADGKRRIEYAFFRDLLEADNPAAEYAQMIHVERKRFPSLDIVPSEPEIYATGLRQNEKIVGSEIQRLQADLQELGALAPKQQLPDKLISGTLHEAWDAYAEDDVKAHNVWVGTTRLKQSGNRRLEMIERFKERHVNMPPSTLGYDTCKTLIRYWCNRPPKKIESPASSMACQRRSLLHGIIAKSWIDSSVSLMRRRNSVGCCRVCPASAGTGICRWLG